MISYPCEIDYTLSEQIKGICLSPELMDKIIIFQSQEQRAVLKVIALSLLSLKNQVRRTEAYIEDVTKWFCGLFAILTVAFCV